MRHDRPSFPERLRRRLGKGQTPPRALKTALVFAVFVAAFVVAATIGRNPDLSHVKVAFLSGSPEGNYYAIVAAAAAQAKRQRGRIDNVASAGSVENMARLAAAKTSCGVQFALVQDGLTWPEPNPFQLVGRLPVSENLVVLGRDADRIRSVADLRGKRIGIGPVGSGTEYVARQMLAQLDELGIKASTHPLQEQLELLSRGELDLGVMVIDPDARLMAQAVRDRKLQIVDLSGAEALAHGLPSARVGLIKAGYYDPVHELPPTDKRVIQIDTLVIGNGCARESVTQGVITALTRVFPEFVRVNRERANLTGLEYASAARSYYDEQGPDRVGEYVPWFIDIMPTARWVQLFFAFSFLFAGQALWHRFRLWRIDVTRVRIEDDVARLFPPRTTVGDIETMKADDRYRTPDFRSRLTAAEHDLARLSERCRRQSLSILVPMGQEMAYRYQEGLVADLLHALRALRERLDAPS